MLRLSDKFTDGAQEHNCRIAGCDMFELQCAPQIQQSGASPDADASHDWMTAVGTTAVQCTTKKVLVCKSVPNSQMKSRNFAHVPPYDILFSI